MREIPLTQGKVALVDDEDFETLNAHKWCAVRQRHTFYAVRNVRLHSPSPRGSTMVKMHLVVLSRKPGRLLARGELPDHVNGNGLDNQRVNLRRATHGQNLRNCRKREALTSRYLGVSWANRRANWRAQIRIDGKARSLGNYTTEDEAALAREFYIAANPELQAKSNFQGNELTL